MRIKSTQQADKILTAAARLFATHRFHEARMEDIASLAEVGKGTLYRYFKDKEELYLALLERAAEGLQARLTTAVQDVSHPLKQLVVVVQALIDYFDEEPYIFELIGHAEAMQQPGGEFPWMKMRRDTINLVKNIFREGDRQGLFQVSDPTLATLMLLGGIRAIIRFGPQPRSASLAGDIVSRFLQGFGGRANPIGSTGGATSSLIHGAQVVDATSTSLHNA